jgi:hypothetical protein
MTADFTIDLDPARRLMTVRMSGFYTLADVQRYADAVREATAKLGGAPEDQRMINDITEMKIQSQEIVEAFRRFMGDPRYSRRRVGFVVTSTLARQQLQRTIGSREARVFTDIADAERWVFAEDRTAHAA